MLNSFYQPTITRFWLTETGDWTFFYHKNDLIFQAYNLGMSLK